LKASFKVVLAIDEKYWHISEIYLDFRHMNTYVQFQNVFQKFTSSKSYCNY